jgi:hypothetical protein
VNIIKIQIALKGTKYPANKVTLVQQATANSADGDVMQLLDRVPEKQYASPADVMREIGKQC